MIRKKRRHRADTATEKRDTACVRQCLGALDVVDDSGAMAFPRKAGPPALLVNVRLRSERWTLDDTSTSARELRRLADLVFAAIVPQIDLGYWFGVHLQIVDDSTYPPLKLYTGGAASLNVRPEPSGWSVTVDHEWSHVDSIAAFLADSDSRAITVPFRFERSPWGFRAEKP